jgi:5-methylcytosine-specific restriction protein A
MCAALMTWSTMPKRAKSPCRHRGCAALVDKPGYCETHADEGKTWKPDRERGSSTERGYGWSWQKLRTQVLKRDHFLCQCLDCKATGRVLEATEVDHIIGKARGGSDDPANLQAINTECHKLKTARERCAVGQVR